MDNQPIEKEIQRVLDNSRSLKNAAEVFVQKILGAETTDADRFAYWNFLFHAGFYNEILNSMCRRLAEKQRIHWGIFIETLAKENVTPSNSALTAILKGIKRQKGGDDLWGCFSWDRWDPRFKEYRSAFLEEKLKVGRERRSELLDRFHFLQSQRLREQAGRLIKRLLFLYPGDEEIGRNKLGFDEEWAREVLSDKAYEIAENAMSKPQAPSSAEAAVIQVLLKATENSISRNPSSAFDFSLLLLFADADEAALRVASQAPRSLCKDWLIAEILFRLRRHVDLLEHLNAIENDYLTDPETAFGVAYLRAQALKDMGQSAAAVEILRNIVQVRPNYRSANHLITEWSVGATG